MGKWLKGAEAFAFKPTKEIVEKYKHMKVRKGSQVSTPAMSFLDIELTPKTISRRIEVTRNATLPMGTFMKP